MIITDIHSSQISFEDESLSSESYYPEKRASSEHSSTLDNFTSFEVGNTKYILICPLNITTVYLDQKYIWLCQSQTSGLKYVGISKKNRESAIEDFKYQLHIRFQQLYAKRPFEMTEDEYNEWIKLANTIDLLHYKTTTPLETREIGCVSYWKLSYPYRIKWITDENYIIDPSKVPGELMSCKTGQWIEAVVKRDPVNYKVLHISSFKKIRFHVPSEEEAQRNWEKLNLIQLKQDIK